ncbi:uncharacterized protein LOC120796061 isoform X2 [Xiphias gladius]|uniref:uncharacterized protein LOC120796061 isoform X2 n=1 Tax=Xiphias gladius TaxID=8245 RepID=UPI001A97F9A0|nr:uncharacterized protein LOC120796061 isoform X2 [Xiphias gladius]
MSDGKTDTGGASEVRCRDAQNSDPEEQEEEKRERETEVSEEGSVSREIPSLRELEEVLHSAPRSCRHGDEVWPNLYLGDMAVAQNRKTLHKLGITHVLNAAHSKQGSIGDQSFYGNTCVYFGIPAEDSDHFDLSQYFKPAADFIHKALKSKDGKVLVHCIMGMSRSATLVLAYLMLRQHLSVRDALRHVVQKRAVYPNRNFLSLLLKLDEQLTLKRSMSLREPPYEPPSVSELQEFLLADRRPTGHVNQVWPNLYIGNEVAARDKGTLHSLGITHIVNAAHGPPNPGPCPYFYVNTGPRFYRDMTVDYYGVEADDAIEFILSPFFYPTARYIRAALTMGGRVFVHCLMGVSRSATLVLAFLMIVEGLRLQEAVAAVRPHRDICPNAGFLQQLRSLDMSLERERRRRQAQTMSVARDKTTLSSLGVTHILNAAAGRNRINTGQQFYSDLELEYHGVEAADHPEFNLRPFFSPAAQFIDSALQKNGKVFVHCAMGVSRSGGLVLAYLMICQGLSLVDAIMAVRLNRDIGPNSGFLEQLRQLDLSLS